MPKLNQVIAVEKGIKSRATAEITEIHKANQKPTLFDGFSKNYSKRSEQDEDQPPQAQRVQQNVSEVLRRVERQLAELFDVTATKDVANTKAFADVTVDGVKLLERVPATYLLFLEKQLTDLHTLIANLPVLDPARTWTLDPNSLLYKSEVVKTTRTKKVQKPLVLYPATDKHPAQTQMITEDEVVGTWEETKLSGAIPAPRKQQLLDRVEKLAKAVKFAREEANDTSIEDQKVSAKVFSWLFA